MFTKEEAKKNIERLIEEFKTHPRKDSMNESDIKTKFIQPLFEHLGWNFRSEDIQQEEKISNGRVDYSFRINEIPKFFLEAKRPSADIDLDEVVDQAKNYAWHKATTWAVLTNFSRVVIYNALMRKEYMASRLRNIYLEEIQNYDKNFDDLWLLSRESFESGLIDGVAERECKKAKLIPVEKKLFEDLNNWRKHIAQDIQKNYPEKYSADELDEIIQILLDRLILIKKIEDTNLEGQKLLAAYNTWVDQSKKDLSEYVREVFNHYKDEYNSGIFNEKEIDKIKLSDYALKIVIQELYSVHDKAIEYDFSIIDADVLGSIYEQYLGYLLKTSEKRVKGEESKAKRKEQGIYYTPRYIVDYIVTNTLGEKLKECKAIEDVEKIKILDPSCGSGSFLIRAFDEIYSWYEQNGFTKEKIILSEEEFATVKDKIIKQNLFGVDLDQKAVELAQLNLLLKTADKKHKLPILRENIKCGNSLVDDEKIVANKAFNWQNEFKPIMEKGGFNVIIGNPPYISYYGSDAIKISEKERVYYKNKFETVQKENDRLNAFWLFLEQGTKLLNEGGFLGFIVNKTLLVLPSYKNLRKYLIKNFRIVSIIPETNPFDIVVDAAIIILSKGKLNEQDKTKFIDFRGFNENKLKIYEVNQMEFLNNPNFEIIFKPKSASAIIQKMETNSQLLKKIFNTSRGVNIGGKSEYFLKEEKTNLKIHKYLIGSENVAQYNLSWPIKNNKNNYLLFDLELEKKLRREGATIVLGNEKRFNMPKLIVNEASSELTATYDESNYYCSYSFHIINGPTKEYLIFLLGIINSKLMTYYCIKNEILRKGNKATPHLGTKGLDRLPVKFDKHFQPQITLLVDKMLSLNKHLVELGNKQTSERQRLEEEIKCTDTEIDELVYQLYDINDDERKIIEEAIKSN